MWADYIGSGVQDWGRAWGRERKQDRGKTRSGGGAEAFFLLRLLFQKWLRLLSTLSRELFFVWLLLEPKPKPVWEASCTG